jgi:hypothetical protein
MDNNLSQLLKSKPGLCKLLSTHGEQTVGDYFMLLNKSVTPIDRNLLQIVRKYSTANLSNSLVHTADHIGLLNHPFFWGAKAASHGDSIFVLATSNISPTNSSHPRGLIWHDSELKEKRANLIPLSWRRQAMYGVPAMSRRELEIFVEKLPIELQKVVAPMITKELVNNNQWLSFQLCDLNQQIWLSCFGNDQKLIYIELESVVNDIIIEAVNKKTGNLHELLNDREKQKSHIAIFDGIPGAHNSLTGQGSHLFWLIDHKSQKRISLTLNEGKLAAQNGVVIPLNPEIIIEKLENRTLMPTLALSYSLLAAEHNMTLAGGFSQIDYLPKMIAAWNKLFNTKSSARGDVFAGELGLVSLKNNDNHILATLSDLLIYSEDVHGRLKLIEQSSNATLSQSLSSIADQLLAIIGTHSDINHTPIAGGVLNVK